MAVTPKSGAIKFSELNTAIFNVTSTNAIRLSDAGKRLGFSSAYKMSDLRGVYGFEITNGTTTVGGKLPTVFSGYRNDGSGITFGSINPATVTGSQTTTGAYTAQGGGTTANNVTFTNVDPAYEGLDADRFCLAIGPTGTVANVRTPINKTSTQFSFIGELFQASGRTNCAVRFI
jgi:hypothetical protein